MILANRHGAAAAIVAVAALAVAGCSTPDRSPTAEAAAPPATPAATLLAPSLANALGLDIARSAASSPEGDGTIPETTRPIVSPPRQVVIPAIDVDAPIIDLGLTADGALETPADFDLAGWWAGGTVADEDGPTVIVGHVDDQDGPAVFFRLQELTPGDPIIVIDALGREARFTVVDKGLYDKDSFPTDRVYGNHDRPTLRLVTCGGDFDRSERSYESNWVIYAVS